MMIGKAIFNRSPLPPNRLSPLPVGAIKPTGWLLEQLQIQARAMKAQYKARPDLFERSVWLGGDQGPEDGAAWFADAAVHIGWQIDDDELKAIAASYVEWALSSQDERGWFGPVPGWQPEPGGRPESDGQTSADEKWDWWPRMLMLRAMQAQFTATGDRRILQCMDKFFRFQLQALPKHPLRDFACARAGENMRVALWLYNLTGQNYLLKLCQLLKDQSLDWTNHFHIFPHIRPMSKQRAWAEMKNGMAREPDGLSGVSQPYYYKEYHLSHGVNVAMALKTPGIVNLFKSGFKEVTAFKVGFGKLMKHHGVAPGVFTADMHLSGTNPRQGVSSAVVVELMHSLEALIGMGDEFGQNLPDILESLAFNSLPAAMDSDMLAYQRVSQPNQMSTARSARGFYNAGERGNLFVPCDEPVKSGQEDQGDEAACLMQGWPRFVQSSWYATGDDGLMAVSYAPVSLNFMAGGERVRVKVSGAYPFGGCVTIEVSTKRPAEFPLYLRIPGWAKQAMIRLPEGEIMSLRAGETACLRRKWTGAEVVSVDLPMEPRISRWHHQSAAVELGALTMCYRPEESWKRVDLGFEVSTDAEWRFALLDGESMKPELMPDKARAFKHADAACVKVKAALVPDWGMDAAGAQQPPILSAVELPGARVIELTPYGCSSLRIAEFPLAPRGSRGAAGAPGGEGAADA